MDNFLRIISRPDNIPIVLLLISVLFCLYLSMRQAFRHDRLIEKSRKDEIYDEMVK
ncbi:MAG: hypothetical protein HY713_07115 [candidate division NC10 bacterium]|nr:hypothetical protein [candidate division NC10 bacterium]